VCQTGITSSEGKHPDSVIESWVPYIIKKLFQVNPAVYDLHLLVDHGQLARPETALKIREGWRLPGLIGRFPQ
jgi:hypothetical protein